MARVGIDPVTGKRIATTDPKRELKEDTFAQAVKGLTKQGVPLQEAIQRETRARGGTIDPTTGEFTAGEPRRRTGAEGAGISDIEARKRAIIEAHKERKISALREQEQQALAAAGRQRGEVGEAALAQRTGLRTEAQRAARSFGEFLAARGLARGGAAVGGEIAQRAGLQAGLGKARAQEARALGDIAAREAQIRQQAAAGIAGAEAQAGIATQQAELSRLQQEAQRQQALEDLTAQREFEAQQEEQARILQEEQRSADLAIEEARRDQDFEREKELLRIKQDLRNEELRLKASSRPATGGAGGLTFTQDRTAFEDQVKYGIAGVQANLDRLTGGTDRFGRAVPATSEQQVSAIYSYLSQLEQQGVDPSVIDAIANSYGVNPQSQRLGLTEQEALGGFGMPRF